MPQESDDNLVMNYLTEERKLYYLDQMEKCRKLRDIPDTDDLDPEVLGWAMDARLEDDMQKLNRFACLQTILSAFPYSAEMAVVHLACGLPPAYVQITYSEAVADEVVAALQTAEKELAAEGVHIEWSDEAKPMEFDNQEFPDELLDLDMVVNQTRYLDIANYLVFFRPYDLESCVHEDGSVNGEKMLEFFNKGLGTIIEHLEKVGLAHEQQQSTAYKHMNITAPPEKFSHYSVDEVAETVSGITTETYDELWNALAKAEDAGNAKPLGGDGSDGTTEEPIYSEGEYGSDLAAAWSDLSEAAKINIHEAAAAIKDDE